MIAGMVDTDSAWMDAPLWEKSQILAPYHLAIKQASNRVHLLHRSAPRTSSESDCIIHPAESTHHLRECQTFLKRPYRIRQSLISQHKLCKRCLDQKHVGRCSIPLDCRRCRRRDGEHVEGTCMQDAPHCALHPQAHHETRDCPVFEQLDPVARRKLMSEDRLCFACLGLHFLSDNRCPPNVPRCLKCTQAHHPLLHQPEGKIDNYKTSRVAAQNRDGPQTARNHGKNHAAFATGPVSSDADSLSQEDIAASRRRKRSKRANQRLRNVAAPSSEVSLPPSRTLLSAYNQHVHQRSLRATLPVSYEPTYSPPLPRERRTQEETTPNWPPLFPTKAQLRFRCSY